MLALCYSRIYLQAPKIKKVTEAWKIYLFLLCSCTHFTVILK